MRVMHSVRHEWLQTTQVWLFHQVRFLPSPVEAHVVCQVTSNLEEFGVPHLHPGSAEPMRLRLWDRALQRLRARRYSGHVVRTARAVGGELLHSHFGPHAWANRGAARSLGVPHVATFYGYDVHLMPQQHPKWRDRYRELFGEAAAILCEGPHMARSIVALGCPADRVKVQHLGVDLEKIEFRPRPPTADRPLRVLIASAFREKKGIPIALEAIGRLPTDLDVEVTVIGDATAAPGSAEEKARILDVIRRRRLGAKVRLLGFQPYSVLLEESYRHDVFLSPSVTASDGDTEGGAPVSLIDMAASGIPIVSTTHCDIPEVILDGETGLLAPERDPDAVRDHLVRLAGQPELGPTLAAHGRARVEAEFDARIQGQRLARIYEDVL